MTHSLKERREARKVLQEKVNSIEENNRAAHQRAQLLVEAMDQEDLDKATQVLDKLRNLKGKGSVAIDNAVQKAEAELNKFTGGGPISGAWNKLKGVVGLKNPVVKLTTLANALETGFGQMPQILNNAIDTSSMSDEEKQTTDDQVITQVVNDPAKQKTLVQNMLKALSPQGFFGAFKQIPYVEKDQLVQDMLTNVKIGDLKQMMTVTRSGTQTSEFAPDLKDVATAGSETKGTSGSEPAKGTTGAEMTSPGQGTARGTETTPSDQKSPFSKVNKSQEVYPEAQQAMARDVVKQTGLDANAVGQVIKTLFNMGKLREGAALEGEASARLLNILTRNKQLTIALSEGSINLEVDESRIISLLKGSE